jgi:hypothetical protein
MADIRLSPGGRKLSNETLQALVMLLVESDSDDWRLDNSGDINGIIGKTEV